MNKLKLCGLVCIAVLVFGCANDEGPSVVDTRVTVDVSALGDLLAQAKRIPNRTGWFEIIKLPNSVYAFWEPGHVEEVSAFLILGSDKDLLYDTGMGIASLADALADLRKAENLPARELMVVNSHNHLDHNGGNREFDSIWTVNDLWAITRLTQGVPAGEAGGFSGYWAQLKQHDGVQTPQGFSAITHSIPSYPIEQVKFLKDGDSIDLGDRQFRVIQTFAHSPDGVALYDENNALFFGGDTFYGRNYLVTDLDLLAADLERIAPLNISWHYASHGTQLIEVMQQGKHLASVRRMVSGDYVEKKTTFAGFELPLYEAGGVTVTLAADLLLY